VAEVASRALARRMGDRAEEIPPALVEAIASSQGDRGEVLRQTERVFQTDRPLELVLFDTDRIAEYVFESSRPPVIAGASAILKGLNAEIAKTYRDFVIFSGGGEGMLLVPAGEGEEICRGIERLYALKTGNALTVTTGFVPVGPHEFISSVREETAADGVRLVSGTQAVLARLRDQVRRKKDERGPEAVGVGGGQERCVSCRDRAVGRRRIGDFRQDPRVDGPLCDPCALRWDVGRVEIAGISFEELVEAAGPEREKSKYIGFLYVDGNSMGALFGSLASLPEIRFLSQAVREVFEELRRQVKKEVHRFAPGRSDRDLPLVGYLGGGDEAIWILPGPLAVHVTEKLTSWIEKASAAITDLPPLLEKKTGVPHVTFGAGLVLCGSSYPVRYQFGLAKELQKNAKSMFYQARGGKAFSSFDFEVLTDSSPLSENLEASRALTDRTEEPGFRRSCRPYAAEGFTALLARMRRLRDEDVKLATSQLYAFQEGSREGRRIFLNFLRYQIARKPAGARYQSWLNAFGVSPADPAAVERFFVQDLGKGSGTWIGDGLQLAPFLGWREG
jgi:hypothetical protein